MSQFQKHHLELIDSLIRNLGVPRVPNAPDMYVEELTELRQIIAGHMERDQEPIPATLSDAPCDIVQTSSEPMLGMCNTHVEQVIAHGRTFPPRCSKGQRIDKENEVTAHFKILENDERLYREAHPNDYNVRPVYGFMRSTQALLKMVFQTL